MLVSDAVRKLVKTIVDEMRTNLMTGLRRLRIEIAEEIDMHYRLLV